MSITLLRTETCLDNNFRSDLSKEAKHRTETDLIKLFHNIVHLVINKQNNDFELCFESNSKNKYNYNYNLLFIVLIGILFIGFLFYKKIHLIYS